LAVRLGGWALVIAAVAFIGVFSYLASQFGYPEVLDGAASDVLPALLAMGTEGRAVWALYAMIPLLVLPAGIGAQAALREATPALGRAAMVLASFSAAALMLGLLRWPSFHWSLAEAYTSTSDASQREAIAAVFDGLNSYLGNFIGEFVGELTLNAFFLVIALSSWRGGPLPKWSAVAGMLASLLGFVAMWRNVTDAVALAAELNNWVLPLWMLGLGVVLVRSGRRATRMEIASGDGVATDRHEVA
jgi:hypothetical protein